MKCMKDEYQAGGVNNTGLTDFIRPLVACSLKVAGA